MLCLFMRKDKLQRIRKYVEEARCSAYAKNSKINISESNSNKTVCGFYRYKLSDGKVLCFDFEINLRTGKLHENMVRCEIYDPSNNLPLPIEFGKDSKIYRPKWIQERVYRGKWNKNFKDNVSLSISIVEFWLSCLRDMLDNNYNTDFYKKLVCAED